MITVTTGSTTQPRGLLKAKFYYASLFGAGSEPASVMEFGFNRNLALRLKAVERRFPRLGLYV